MFHVYVIQNPAGILYKGQTRDLDLRMQQHNGNSQLFTIFTKSRGPWKLIYSEQYNTRKEAIQRERFLKSGKGREFLKGMLPR